MLRQVLTTVYCLIASVDVWLPTCIKWTFLIFFFQGQKGESGSAAKPPQGAIKFGDTAEKCTLRNAGTVRYNASQNALQLCDGNAWLLLVTGGKGHVASRPGRHCLDILNSGEFEMKLKKFKNIIK